MANKYAQHSKKYNIHKRIHGAKCIHKKQFPSGDEASAFAEARSLDQKPYKCPICPCWHLRSRKKARSTLHAGGE